MSGPRFVKVKPGDKWVRAEDFTALNLAINGNGVWTLTFTPEGNGDYVTYPSEAAARKALSDLLETFGGLDLTN